MLEAETDILLGYSKDDSANKNTDNVGNRHTKKTVKSQVGTFELDILKNRRGEYVLQIVPKSKRGISGIEKRVKTYKFNS